VIQRLTQKIRSRIKARDRQRRLFLRTGKRGHARAAGRHARAVRYLRALLRRARDSGPESDTSEAGVRFIADFEGFLAVPSDELDGHATVGIGHLIHFGPVTEADRKGIWVEGQKQPGRLTREEAERLLARDLAQKFEPAVRELFGPGGYLEGRFEQTLFDALVSAAYNLGPGVVRPGTPGFETIGRAIQSRNRTAIADALLLYDKANGQALPGLTRRRRAERRLILAGEYG
jgi:GH24 family phage-related lysozyme (muramidase)